MTAARQYSVPSDDSLPLHDLGASQAELEKAVKAVHTGLAGQGARRGRIWALGVLDSVGSLTGAFERHAAMSESALENLLEIAPQLGHVAVQLEDEHEKIIITLEECLCRLRREPSAPETEWVNELRVQLIEALHALANHREREECFVYDTFESETGGGD
ncbi:MAG: hypothetical protein HKO03_06815 [Acidimicrobiia bacterium]|nr:hypothetical protein [Acidimicrobiia bacterium]